MVFGEMGGVRLGSTEPLVVIIHSRNPTPCTRTRSEAPSKLSSVEHMVNRMLYLILAAQLAITAISLACYLVWNKVMMMERGRNRCMGGKTWYSLRFSSVFFP